MKPEKSNRRAVRSAGKISIINGFGFISALLIDIIIAGQFGLGQETDALFIALTIPQLIASIFLVTTNVALVPLFTKVLLQKGKEGQWALTSNLVSLGLFLFSLIGLLGAFFSPVLVNLLGAGLDQPTKELATNLNRLLFLMVIPIGAVEVMKATLNALHHFAYPAATAVLKNLVVFFTIIITPSIEIHVVAIGYVLATFVQLLFLAVSLFLKGFRYRFSLDLQDRWTREALKQMRHPLTGAIMGQGNVIVERFLASFLPLGVVSALGYARRILRAVDNIFLGSVTIAFLPHLSAQSASSDAQKFKRTLTTSIKMLAFISFPITALVFGLSESIVQLLFERGEFSVDDRQIMALLLSIYVVSIPAWAIFQALQTAYYSTGDTKRPFLFRISTLILNIILDFSLFYFIQASGLALALVLARTFVTILSAWVLHKRIEIISTNLLSFLIRVGVSAVLLGISIFLLRGQFESIIPFSNYTYLVDMVMRALLGMIIFTSALFLLRVQEVLNLLQQMKMRLRPSN
ncbi:murein biosynthesis integral membrane protein MurJ [Candidatus Leptofilum sp.]|uniref:murein biosynthesis integral membrane protein MurJ n=1 Tax=Candidatus Leptofilum sp. TaxID=3241576 RepID=UPI003B5C03AD